MNAKLMIVIVAAFAMLFAGVAVASESSAGTEPAGETTSVQVSYTVDDVTVSESVSKGDYTLKDLSDLNILLGDYKVFKGWQVVTSDVASGTIYAAGSSYTVNDNTTFKAEITPAEYKYTVIDGANTLVDKKIVSSKTYDVNDYTITLPTEDELKIPTGYVFTGFAVDGEVVAQAGDSIVLTKDMVFTATYELDIKVSFVVDGVTTYTHEMTGLMFPTDPVKESFSFIGWEMGGKVALNAGMTSESGIKALEALNLTADTTFTAVFEPAIYTVSFVVDGDVAATQTVKHGELATEPAFIPALEGMDFIKWDFDFTQAITGDTVIEAVFEPTPEPEPTGLSNPTVQIMAIAIGVLAIFIVAVLVWKKDDVRVIIVKKLDKSKKPEEPKQ